MKIKVNRIILDTNLWINFLITKDYTKLDDLITSKQSIIVFSTELLEEFLEVVNRPKFKTFFSKDDIEALLLLINEIADFVRVVAEVNICRDVKDNFLLALAIDGQADYLLTADKDLLELGNFAGATITTIFSFLNEQT